MKSVFKPLFFLISLVLWSLLTRSEGACTKREVPVFVTNKDGSIVTTLTSSDFRLDSHGSTMSIVGWNHDTRQHRVVILLDVSGSMRGAGPRLWPVVLALARNASNAGNRNSSVALVLFSDHAVETVEFSQGRDAIRNKLQHIARDPAFPDAGKEGDSRIYDTLKEGYQLLGNPTSADSFLVITDGADEGSKSTPDEILHLFSSSLVRVFAILVNPIPGEDLTSRPNVLAFTGLVQKTGGKGFGRIDAGTFRNSVKTSEGQRMIDEQLDQFYEGIFGNEVLTIQTPPEIQRPTAIRLSFTNSAQRQLKNARIFFPHEIGRCLNIGASQ